MDYFPNKKSISLPGGPLGNYFDAFEVLPGVKVYIKTGGNTE